MQLSVFADDISRPYYDEPINKEARDSAYELLERLAYESYEQLPGAKLSIDGIPYFEFDGEAHESFTQWYNDLKQKEASEKDVNVQAHIGKYYGLLPLLALIFFLIDKIAGVTNASAIEISHIELSIRWCTVLESHARKMYALTEESSLKSLKQKIINYVEENPHKLPATYGEISGNIRGVKAEDVEQALEGIAFSDGRKVIKII
jgi:hypothetical protein